MRTSIDTTKIKLPQTEVVASGTAAAEPVVAILPEAERRSAVFPRTEAYPRVGIIEGIAARISSTFRGKEEMDKSQMPVGLKSHAEPELLGPRASVRGIIEGMLDKTRGSRIQTPEAVADRIRTLLDDLGLGANGRKAASSLGLTPAGSGNFEAMLKHLGVARSMLELARMTNMPPAEIISLAGKLKHSLSEPEIANVKAGRAISVLPTAWRSAHSADFENPTPTSLKLISHLLDGFAQELARTASGLGTKSNTKAAEQLNESALKVFDLALRYDLSAENRHHPNAVVQHGWKELKKILAFQ